MVLGAVGDTPYRIVLLLHILTVLVAFAPAFTHSLLANQTRALDGDGRQTVIGFMAVNGRRIYAPALILTGLLGFALQGMSGGAWGFGQGWFIAAIVVWVAMNGILHGMLLPAERKLAAGDASGEAGVQRGGMLMSLLLLVMLYLMVFKPGI